MEIVNLKTKVRYEIDEPKSRNENSIICPECSQDRKKKSAKPLRFNGTKMVGECHHCSAKFMEYKPFFKKKEDYVLPVWKNRTELSDNAVKWFEKRGIFQEVLRAMKVYTDTEWMPQVNANVGVICFPYFLDDTLVNIKYRDSKKNFKLSAKSELIFYNLNCIKDSDSVIITEGEIDALSYIQAGFNNCISVPNGASNKSTYIDNYIELFDRLTTIYISTDSDSPGLALKNELIIRFGQERCRIIELNECKDANEFLVKYGAPQLKLKVESARELPVEGVINVEDNYEECYNLFMNGLEKGKEIGFYEIDETISWELGRVVVVTGIPGHGKSEFVDFVTLKLCRKYDWKIGFFSPENYPFKYHFSKLSSKIVGKSFDSKYMFIEEFEDSFRYIKDNIFFVYPEDDMSFENILLKAKFLVKRHGIKQFVIDPYNKIEHLRKPGESETDYISKFLDKVTMFAKKYQVLFWVVAHPRKIQKTNGMFEVPTLYDINGSANWYNKTDYGITIYRDFENKTTQLHVQKVKFKHLGEAGTVVMNYNYMNGRYESLTKGNDPSENISISMQPNEGFEKTSLEEAVIEYNNLPDWSGDNPYQGDEKAPF